MWAKQTDLYADNNLSKTFIAICTPKRWCYVYVIVVYVLTVSVKNVSIICLYLDISGLILIISNTIIYSVSSKIFCSIKKCYYFSFKIKMIQFTE